MFRVVVRGFAQRKLRVLLTGIAVALGVALMAGTYILTDTINSSFASIFQTASKGHDVVVTPAETLGKEAASETTPITQAMLEKVRATAGVAKAAGSIFTPGTFLSTDGKRLTSGHAPAFINSIVPAPFETFTAVKGRFPATAREVAVDEATAQREGLRIGQQIVIAAEAATARYTIVGILRFGSGESFGGAGIALLVPSEAQRIVGERGAWDQIDVSAAHGVTPEQLRRRIRAELPQTVDVRTGAQQAAKNTSNLEEQLGFLRTFLLIFAYVALVVGAFIIFNTFSITVAQRTRELGLLRTLGASRAQVLRSVLYEGLMLGLLGAVVGLFAGIGVAPALDQLFKALGADIPDNGTVLETRTIVVSLLVGVGVTVLAGLAPALRATRVPPIAAMREGVGIPPRPLPTRRALIVRFLAGLVVVLAIGAVAGGLGLVLLVVWVARAARLWVRLRRGGERPPRHYRIVPAVARALGSLVRWRGVTGRLAEENTVRQPGRTMITAAALMIGIALVAFVAVLADGTKATINSAVSRTFAGDLIVENSQGNGQQQGIPAAVAEQVRSVPGVASVTAIAFTKGRLQGSSSNASITVVEPASFAHVYRVEWHEGSDATLLALGTTGTVVTKGYADSQHLKVGQQISVLTPTDKHVRLRIEGIASDNARLLGDLTITRQLAQSAFGQREDALDFVDYLPGFTNAQVQPAVDRLLNSSFPQTRSRTAAQFKQDLTGQVNTLLTLIYVLLALSVIVSLFGIVNTLVLSIYERTRELGMLRAIGASRRQIRQMIRYESLITALIGGVLGLVIGVVGSLIVTSLTLSESGYVQAIPVPTLLILLVVAAGAGLLAALLPARRAARLDPLRALAAE
ncbi:MAG: ABC transporter permease [Solirubrobacteraceae bacterium]